MQGKKLIVANWKMNPVTYEQAEKLAKEVIESSANANAEVVLCPPFVWLTDLSHKLAGEVKFGAQDVFWEEEGAFTGEVSAAMLKDSNVEYVIIGHSERRRHLGETDEMINKKVRAALEAGLKVILCVGESAEVRKKGISAAKEFVKAQLIEDLKGINHLKLKAQSSKLSVAYEPIWAISGGDPTHAADNPKSAVEMITFIKSLLATCYSLPARILYGGSVNASNAASFLQEKEIDGALVGGASLKSKEFAAIINVASNTSHLKLKA